MPALRPFSLWLLAALFALPACDSGGEVDGPDDIDYRTLFAAPTAEEVAAVEAEWAARENPARNARIVAEGMQDSTGAVYVIEHTQTGAGGGDVTHYGLVRIPGVGARVPRPVVVVHHDGDDGLSVSGFLAALDLYPVLRDETVQVAPVYRSETLTADAAGLSGTYTAGGEPSPWDYDVDDAIGLLNAALELFPDAMDPAQVGALGFGRGGNAALLHAVRDDRVDVVTDYFGPADFFNPAARALATEAVAGNPDVLALPGVQHLADTVLDPLRDGSLSYADARLALVRRSPGLFAGRLPDTQVHHHRQDPVVPIQFSEAFGVLAQGAVDGAFDANVYTNALPTGVGSYHDPAAMPASLRDTERFFVLHLPEGE